MASLNTNTRYLHGSVVDYARRLAATLPDPLHVCFFVNSRLGGQRPRAAARRRAHRPRGRDRARPRLPRAPELARSRSSPYKFNGAGGRGRPRTTHVAALPTEPGALDSLRAQIERARRVLRRVAAGLRRPDRLSAGLPAPARSRRCARPAGVCVADEVQVGFGRIGEHFWGFELDGVVPDIVTLGKPIGNGHPLGAVVTTPEVAASFVTGMEYFNTFGGNPVSAEIGLAVLDVIADERLQAHALAMGDAAARRQLRGARRRRRRAATGCSSASSSTRRERAARVKEGLKARGVLISTDGPNDDVLKIKPPLVISADDCDRFLEALCDVL